MTSVGTVISYPIPAYQNLPINSDFYIPSRFVISAISLGLTTTVTTSVDHNYVIGQQIRLLIPVQYGSYQLNNVQGTVISVPSTTQVEINVDSQQVNAFIASPTTSTIQQPQILDIGDFNSGIISSTGRVIPTTNIPGSFINVSPQ